MSIGTLGGFVVLDWSDPLTQEYLRDRAGLGENFDLRYDEMYPASSVNAIVVGEAVHFRWRMRQIDENYKARQEAADHIKQFAEKVLGEPWKLSH